MFSKPLKKVSLKGNHLQIIPLGEKYYGGEDIISQRQVQTATFHRLLSPDIELVGLTLAMPI